MRADDAMLTAILEALPDPVVITDSGRRVLLANQEALWTFGYRSADLLGRSIGLLLPAAVSAGRAIGRRKDGSEFPVEVQVRAVHSGTGSLEVVCIRDVAVAHESKNALCVLSSRVDVMLLEAEETGLLPHVREDLGVLQRAARRLAGTLERLPRPAAPSPSGSVCAPGPAARTLLRDRPRTRALSRRDREAGRGGAVRIAQVGLPGARRGSREVWLAAEMMLPEFPAHSGRRSGERT